MYMICTAASTSTAPTTQTALNPTTYTGVQTTSAIMDTESFNNENVISVISCCCTDRFNLPCHAISVHSRDVSALVSIHWMAILAPFAIFLVLLVIRIVSRMCKTCFQKTCVYLESCLKIDSCTHIYRATNIESASYSILWNCMNINTKL